MSACVPAGFDLAVWNANAIEIITSSRLLLARFTIDRLRIRRGRPRVARSAWQEPACKEVNLWFTRTRISLWYTQSPSPLRSLPAFAREIQAHLPPYPCSPQTLLALRHTRDARTTKSGVVTICMIGVGPGKVIRYKADERGKRGQKDYRCSSEARKSENWG